MLALYIALAPVLIILGWLYTISTTRGRFPTLRNQRICLLIAHPDDEAMFFAPALLQLTKPEAGNHVKILCLSSGDADGLGETRKKELVRSGMMLGLRSEEDVFVVEKPEFKDSMTATWPAPSISTLLTSAFAPHLTTPKPKSRTSEAPKPSIDVLITFDATGISSHPNHISLYHGARLFISTLLSGRPSQPSPVALYTLSSVNMVRKYSSVVDVLTSLVSALVGKKSGMGKGVLEGDGRGVSPLLFFSDVGEARRAQRAMTHAHVSQMRWFRWGWIGLSRYMVVNDLRLEKVSAGEGEGNGKKAL